ncbi:MAG: hypothetical protein RQ826_14435 [Xanthomonadales bacterium]|nr:hypothetical protein [Xanthomonadales bacterium]
MTVWDRAALPDFDAMEDTVERKRAFFKFLAPIMAAENERAPGRLAEEYDVTWDPGLVTNVF